MPSKTALIVGSNGLVGRALAEQLAESGDWGILELSRRPSPLGSIGTPIAVDLQDREACLALGPKLRDVTHLFYCARAVAPDLFIEEQTNLAMFTNILDAVESAASKLSHVQVMEGTKWYGSHLGSYKTPAHEDDQRHFPPNFYYVQQDLAAARQKNASWTWSALRPHVVWGVTLGYPHSFVVLLAAYATMSKHLGMPLVFPGSQACYTTISQATDALLLAKAMEWAATSPKCANEAFNITNGDLFRWQHLWPQVADYFGMEAGQVQSLSLAARMKDLEAIWRDVTKAHELRPMPFSSLGNWAYFDYTVRFDVDDISLTTKARHFGFEPFADTKQELFSQFDRLRDLKVIP
ncbi:MAG: hypothetical protein BGN87_01785 [Rhizobiales bacterium 65-79]|jgi:nucleoside-diphosphate-sugar epimerase|nr:SDR family oxidoreductase [Hyphomicrobiales bacterium]OJU05762.1 MAG: hypothetical protein BGN87_01785 [Rhizobiales bacterium 65-79]